jgi:ABC-type Fe3+/spermidine/putrescine transport system ATPase subunit
VLLLDEPFGALDKKLREQMQLELKELHRRIAITTIFVTHDQEEALIISDRIAVMSGGRIEQLAEPHALYERPDTRFVLEFVGASNLFEGKLRRAGAGAILETPEGLRIGLAACDLPEGEAQVMVRPEKIRLVQSRTDATDNALEGRIVDVVYLGTHNQFVVDVAGRPVKVFAQNLTSDSGPFDPGQPVLVTFAARDALIVRR